VNCSMNHVVRSFLRLGGEASLGELFHEPCGEVVLATWRRSVERGRAGSLQRIGSGFGQFAFRRNHQVRDIEWTLKIFDQWLQLIDGCFLQPAKHYNSLITKQRLGLSAHDRIGNCGLSFVGGNRFEIVAFKHGVAVAIANEFGGEVGELCRNQTRITASNEIHRHTCILADRCSATRKTAQIAHNNTFAIPCGETRSPTAATHHTHRVPN